MNEPEWKFKCSGRYAENVLYQYGKGLENEHFCHSFVVDPWDKSYRVHDVFTDDEIAEIKSTSKKTLTQIPDELFTYLKLYKKATTFQQARDLLFTQQPWNLVKFNITTTVTATATDSLRSSMYNIAHELEAGDIGSEERSESWLIGRIWSVVDRAFDNLLDVKVTRGEKTSTSSSTRKNRDQIPQGRDGLKRNKMGRRLDMIIRRKRFEVGGGEAGKEQGSNDTKIMRERDLKLPKALKDMMSALVINFPSKVSSDIVITDILQYDKSIALNWYLQA
ncbi:hypothetical protein BDC45DRAFT_442465 [Circinella umbellata]|nr:hypothetical protein BDC45DRAFT_442465 [Circinella umbellata]